MGVFKNLSNWINATDMEELDEEAIEQEKEEEEEIVVKPSRPARTRMGDSNRPLPSSRDCAIAIFTPQTYKEATKIGDVLKARKAAIVNVTALPKEQSKRITDFLQGIVFAIDGDYFLIGDKIILYVPKNIDVADVDGTASKADE